MKIILRWLAALAVLSVAHATQAQNLVVGSAYRPLSLDPHLTSINDTNSILSHVYERLVWQDETLQLRPALAESWRLVDSTTWEITLRPDARFHDGSLVTAEDVAFSVARIRVMNSSPSTYAHTVAAIARVDVLGPRVFRIITAEPYPRLPLDIAAFFVVARTSPADPARQIGSGPFLVEEFRAGEQLILRANRSHWAGRPAWDRVELRAIRTEAGRVVALMSGDVDVIDYVRSHDLDRIKARGLGVVSGPAPRSNFIAFDIHRSETPLVTDLAGQPIANPFRDARVRRALSLAIDRDAIVERLLGGYATAGAQVFPPGFAGTSRNLTAPRADPAQARMLLAEAGYPNGFAVTLHGTSDRYPGDSATLQAVAQMWTRIGVRTTPVPLIYTVYAAARARGEYSVYYAGASGGDISQTARSLLHTRNTALGRGVQNLGGYSNPAVDRILSQALAEFETDRRDALFAEATELAMADQPIIPLYHYHNIWAFGRKVTEFRAHPRGWTTAMQAVPAR